MQTFRVAEVRLQFLKGAKEKLYGVDRGYWLRHSERQRAGDSDRHCSMATGVGANSFWQLPERKGVIGMEELKFHEVAEVFPMLAEDALQNLADDIAKHGLREAICVDAENRIVDGRNRYLACKRVGAEMRFYDCPETESLVDLVLSLNLHRRHLEKGQRATAATRAMAFYGAKAKDRQGTRTDIPEILPGSNPGDAREKAGEKFGVSEKYVSDAIAVSSTSDMFRHRPPLRADDVVLQRRGRRRGSGTAPIAGGPGQRPERRTRALTRDHWAVVSRRSDNRDDIYRRPAGRPWKENAKEQHLEHEECVVGCLPVESKGGAVV